MRDRNGETNYFPIRCFGKLAESVTNIKKGTKVFVDGELEISSFTSDEGDKRMTFRVVAETYRILDSGRNAPTSGEEEVPSDEEVENLV